RPAAAGQVRASWCPHRPWSGRHLTFGTRSSHRLFLTDQDLWLGLHLAWRSATAASPPASEQNRRRQLTPYRWCRIERSFGAVRAPMFSPITVVVDGERKNVTGSPGTP